MPTNLDDLELTTVDRNLIRRLVPGVKTVYLAALDKGLSGSFVWRAQWSVGGARSKEHIIKVGPLRKIRREYKGFSEIAAAIDPHCGHMTRKESPRHARGALRHEFARAPGGDETRSLRQTIQALRAPEDAAALIRSLYEERLGGWHFPPGATFRRRFVELGDALDWWTKKIDLPETLQSIGYDGMRSSVRERCDVDVATLPDDVERILSERIPAAFGPVHGDLHSQNVLVVGSQPQLIDFGWTHRSKWRAVDFLMLECSLKFLAAPSDALLDDLLALERSLESVLGGGEFEWADLGGRVHGDELAVVGAAVEEIRRCALESGAVTDAPQYRLGLAAMTAGLASIPQGINRVFLFHSLALHTRVILHGGQL
jgi:hypothetical protein